MEATQTSWRSLGELFVERGLISEADLERALAEQVATKRRLADILVRRGLVTGHDITNALMEQLGTGSTAQAAPRTTGTAAAAAATAPVAAPTPAPAPKKRPVEVVPMPEPAPAAEPEPVDVPEPAAAEAKPEAKPEPKPAAKKKAKPAPAAPVAPVVPTAPLSEISYSYDLSISAHALIAEADSRRRGAEAELIAAREAHAQVIRGLEQVRAELEARDLSADSLTKELEQTQIRLRAREQELANEVALWDEAKREAERCGGQLAELQGRLEEKEHELSEASASAAAWAARTAELDAETEALSGRVEDALDTLETLATTRFAANGADLSRRSGSAQAQSRKRTPQTGALYFVPKAEGYDLIERDGELPAVGEALAFGDEQFVVTKIGRSPLPFDRRSCVFLTAV